MYVGEHHMPIGKNMVNSAFEIREKNDVYYMIIM